MKTPEEIKNSLGACSADECHGEHVGCAYSKSSVRCMQDVCGDGLALIKRLECELEVMKAYMRYIAVELPSACKYCVHNEAGKVCEQECYGQGLEHFAFEWRGLPDDVFKKREEV